MPADTSPDGGAEPTAEQPAADVVRLLAGDCTVTFDDADETREERGNVVAICKPGTIGVDPPGNR